MAYASPQTVTRVGDDELAVVIDREQLEALGIDEETPIEVVRQGDALVIRRVAPRSERLRQSTDRLMDAHDETLRKLAR